MYGIFWKGAIMSHGHTPRAVFSMLEGERKRFPGCRLVFLNTCLDRRINQRATIEKLAQQALPDGIPADLQDAAAEVAERYSGEEMDQFERDAGVVPGFREGG